MNNKVIKEKTKEVGKDVLLEAKKKELAPIIETIEKKDYAKAIALCEAMMGEGNMNTDMLAILSYAYFARGDVTKALELITSLLKTNALDPQVVLVAAEIYRQQKNYSQLIKVVGPLYKQGKADLDICTMYAEALYIKKKYVKALEVYRDILQFHEAGNEVRIELLEVVFSKVVILDMLLKSKNLSMDMDAYISFLSTQSIHPKSEERIAFNLVEFSDYLPQKNVREPFKILLDYLSKNNVLTKHIWRETLESGYVSYESYLINENPKISKFTFDFITSFIEMRQEEQGRMMPRRGYEQQGIAQILKHDFIFRKYYATKRVPSILEEFSIIKSLYPTVYSYVEAYDKELRGSVAISTEKYKKELIAFDKKYVGRKFKEDAILKENNQVYIKEYNDIPLYGNDVRRNDPCPCGSGKKYKMCCGKNVK